MTVKAIISYRNINLRHPINLLVYNYIGDDFVGNSVGNRLNVTTGRKQRLMRVTVSATTTTCVSVDAVYELPVLACPGSGVGSLRDYTIQRPRSHWLCNDLVSTMSAFLALSCIEKSGCRRFGHIIVIVPCSALEVQPLFSLSPCP